MSTSTRTDSPVASKKTTPKAVALSRADAAAMYSISTWTVDELIAAGEVQASKKGRRVLVDAASMHAWYERLEDA